MLNLVNKVPFWQRVLAAFAFGALAGLVLGPAAETWLKPIGDVYLSLVKMLVVPLILFSVSTSVARLNGMGNVARLGGRTLLWFLATSTLAVLVGIAVGHLINPGLGLGQLPLGEVKPRTIPSPLEVLIGVVPANPIKAMADGNVLQVLFLALLIGAAFAVLGEKVQRARDLFEDGTRIIFRMTRWVIQLTPLATFALIAWVVGKYGLTALAPLAKFIFAMYLACLLHIFVVYGGLLKLHGLSPARFFAGAFPAQQLAFASASSFATLPVSERVAVERLGVPREYASFAVPLGATMKMDGCGAIYPAIASIFVAQYFNLDLSLTQYVLIGIASVLGAIGTAGVPGTAIVMLTLTLNTAGLPLEGVAYIIAIDRVIDMMRTATNVTGQILVPVLVAKEEGLLDARVYNGEIAVSPGSGAEEPRAAAA